jgi:AraC-like DNA-binding protein
MLQSTQPNVYLSPGDPLCVLAERGANVHRANCGLTVIRFDQHAIKSPVALNPQPGYALVLDARTPAYGGQARIANLAEGALVHPTDNEWLLAFIPERSFESVAGRWQLSVNPVQPGFHRVGDDRVARHLCLTLLCSPAPASPLYLLFANSIANALLAHFLDTYCPVARPAAPSQPGMRLSQWQLRVAEETMLDRLDLRLPLSVVAERCGVSVVHFSRAFRHTTSETPHRWLMRRRLERACVLLAETNESISEIALACGFSDQSHLTRTFSILINTTPGVWRQKRRRQS